MLTRLIFFDKDILSRTVNIKVEFFVSSCSTDKVSNASKEAGIFFLYLELCYPSIYYFLGNNYSEAFKV